MFDLAVTLTLGLISVIIYMTGWFLLGRIRRRIDVADTAWGGAFIVIALVTWATHFGWNRLAAVVVLVLIWGLRLSLHIAKRNHGKPEDPRYIELAEKWKGHYWARAYVSIFLTQSILAWVISLPVMLIAAAPTEPIDIWALLGALVWAVGFAIERAADTQLRMFLKQPRPKGAPMAEGLWRYSRHPNYFGELTQWWGIWLMAVSTRYGFVAIIGPLTITILIRFVSGVPPLERRHLGDPAYQDYRRRTSLLIPWPPKG